MTKSLSKAVALAATLGAAASAHAVNVNQDGLGQVLLYPVYTAEEGNVTAIHVTNTTDKIKAVKVRFVEGMNSQEVLDFNLYLSPKDMWTGGVVQTATGAALVTQDKSCTAGALAVEGQPFVTFLFDGSFGALQKDSVSSAARTRVGHLEVIEMGEVDPALVLAGTTTAGAAIIHGANGAPGNCDAVRTAWNTGGVWQTTPAAGMTAGEGGLYGSLTVTNVDKGTQFAVDATAIDNFSVLQLHREPGSEAPSLNNAQVTATFPNGSTRNYTRGVNAVSAVLMKESISNDYAFGAGLNAQSDFVVTFPTKTFFVNNAGGVLAGGVYTPAAATAPFTKGWNIQNSSACEAISVSYYDREERTKQLSLGQISPRPPQVQGISLCNETNVFSIGTSKVIGGEFVRTSLSLDNTFQTGWMNIDLTGAGRTLSDVVPAQTHEGLPVIGFTAVAIQNGDVGGLLSNYSAAYNLKGVATVVAP